jgi:hypothetical protein
VKAKVIVELERLYSLAHIFNNVSVLPMLIVYSSIRHSIDDNQVLKGLHLGIEHSAHTSVTEAFVEEMIHLHMELYI